MNKKFYRNIFTYLFISSLGLFSNKCGGGENKINKVTFEKVELIEGVILKEKKEYTKLAGHPNLYTVVCHLKTSEKTRADLIELNIMQKTGEEFVKPLKFEKVNKRLKKDKDDKGFILTFDFTYKAEFIEPITINLEAFVNDSISDKKKSKYILKIQAPQ